VNERHVRPPFVVVLLALAAVPVATWGYLTIVGHGQVVIGRDYRLILWAPWHGLLAGFNPYAGAPGYLSSFQVDLPASWHAPWVLLATAPVTSLPYTVGLAVWIGASEAMLWAAAWVMIPPTTWRRAGTCVALAALLAVSGPAIMMLRLGQVTAPSVLGLALIMRWPRSAWAVVGVVLLTINPQFGLPMGLLLAGLGYWRPVATGWVIAAAASVPVVVWAGINGGLPSLLTSPEAGIASDQRVDAAGMVMGHGSVGAAVGVVLTACLAWVLRRRLVELSTALAFTLTAWCLVAVYSQPYSLLYALLLALPVVLSAGRERWFAGAVVGLCLLWALPLLNVGGPIKPDSMFALESIPVTFALIAAAVAGLFPLLRAAPRSGTELAKEVSRTT
jgi:hypothetical protein